jgi:periplasmic protein TonB
MPKVHLEFWKREAAASAPRSAGLSTFMHVVLIGAWVAVSGPAMNQTISDGDERVWYLPPPNTRPAQSPSVETLRYVEIAPEGLGAGLGMVESADGVELQQVPADGQAPGNAGQDLMSSPELSPLDGADSVFTIIEVDTVATRLPESAAPRYPAELLEQRVEGQAIVQFVVDTSGRADSGSFEVVVSSHPGFTQSVREALPGMRFAPARIGTTKVRQLVELPFTFKVAQPVPADTVATRTATKRPPA